MKKNKKAMNFATDKNGTVILQLLFKKQVKKYFREVKLPFLLDFLRWVIIDIARGKRKKIFGVWLFCGLFGNGKTLSAVKYAKELKDADSSIHVYANINVSFADGRINSYKDLLDLPPRSIVIIDEIQATFATDSWRDFPPDLLAKITQCRKKELMILCTAQIFSRVVKQIREVTSYVVQCSNVMSADRLFQNKFFNSYEYERWFDAQGGDNKYKIKPFMRRLFVADDDAYALYDTLEEVESLKKQIRKIS